MADMLLIQGANMQWLGRRQPELYGTMTPGELDEMVRAHAGGLGVTLDIVYTAHEGSAIESVYGAYEAGVRGLVMNPAGFTYNGDALRDAILGCEGLHYIEVHMSNLAKRDMRSRLVAAADGMIMGFGANGYLLALDGMAALLGRR